MAGKAAQGGKSPVRASDSLWRPKRGPRARPANPYPQSRPLQSGRPSPGEPATPAQAAGSISAAACWPAQRPGNPAAPASRVLRKNQSWGSLAGIIVLARMQLSAARLVEPRVARQPARRGVLRGDRVARHREFQCVRRVARLDAVIVIERAVAVRVRPRIAADPLLAAQDRVARCCVLAHAIGICGVAEVSNHCPSVCVTRPWNRGNTHVRKHTTLWGPCHPTKGGIFSFWPWGAACAMVPPPFFTGRAAGGACL